MNLLQMSKFHAAEDSNITRGHLGCGMASPTSMQGIFQREEREDRLPDQGINLQVCVRVCLLGEQVGKAAPTHKLDLGRGGCWCEGGGHGWAANNVSCCVCV